MTDQAKSQVNRVSGIVNGKLSQVLGWAAATKAQAENTLASMGLYETPTISVATPTAPALTPPVLPEFTALSLGRVTSDPRVGVYSETTGLTFNAPELPGTPTYETPKQASLPPTLNLPAQVDAPEFVSQEVVPDFSVQKPAAPTMRDIERPTLIPISVGAIDFPTVPTFSGEIEVAPNLNTAPRVSMTLERYSSAELTALIERDKEWLLGEGYDESVEQRMYQLLVDQSERDLFKVVNESVTQWASRGFSIAPGMLVGKVADAELEKRRAVRTHATKVRDESAQLGFDRLKAATASLLALEKQASDLDLAQAAQLIEVERINVNSTVELFNSSVQLFNARQQARAISAAAYKQQLDATMEVAQKMSLLGDAEMLKAGTNNSLLTIREADVGTLKAQSDLFTTSVQADGLTIEAYNAKLSGLLAQSSIEAANLDMYRTQVKGYAEAVQAASLAVSADSHYYSAAASATGVQEANARSAATHVQQASKVIGSYKTYVSAESELLRANLQAYMTAADSRSEFIQAKSAEIRANAAILSAEVNAYEGEVGAVASFNRAGLKYASAAHHYALTASEGAMRASSLQALAKAEADKVNVAAAAAKATVAASLAQGAMSAMHVSATTSGSGQISSQGAIDNSVSLSWGGSMSQAESIVHKS